MTNLAVTKNVAARWRGQPVLLLAALLLSYSGLRAAMWHTPFPIVSQMIDSIPGLHAQAPAKLGNRQHHLTAKTETVPTSDAIWTNSVAANARLTSRDTAISGSSDFEKSASTSEPWTFVASGRAGDLAPRMTVGHSLLLLAGLAEMPVPAEVVAVMTRRNDPDDETFGMSAADSRSSPDWWSLGSWLFLREGSLALAVNGVRPASYGASQAGAVLRYRLAPSSGNRPTAYARATRALTGPSDSEAALGFSARPLVGLPVSVHAEMRVRSSAGGSEVRPAAFIVSEFPPVNLPLGTVGEAYVQAGYVGGEFATGFADGQARISRELAEFRLGKLRAGAGAWGGAQRGAARVDIGPSASLDFRIGETNSRAQVDYRIRVAGDAQPGDGIAFTLSTGF